MSAVFIVRATNEDRAFAHPIPEAQDALDAAVRFAERWAAGHGEISVTVTECTTGQEQCFRVDLDDESADPC